MPRVRVHQHVNPFSPHYRQEPAAIDPEAVFKDPTLPLHLDIGCARGRFILKMAEVQPNWNYLGVEIREPLVDEANRLAAEAGLLNLHYAFCNAMLWLGSLIKEVPDDMLRAVTIQFPDPWFKKKHAKRRMVNKDLVDTLAEKVAPGGHIFVQTDIESLAAEMFALFRANQKFTEAAIGENPFQVKTEREKAVEEKSLPVYRSSYFRPGPSA